MDPFELRAGPLTLDQPGEGDIDRIAEYCQDPLFERFLTIPWPYERQHSEHFVTVFVPNGWASGDELTWALRTGGEFLGVVGLRRSGMIGYWLGAPHRGRGHMARAVNAVIDWSFEAGFIDPVRWECVAGNLASASVARSVGFRFTGTGPATVTGRDGTHPESWHGELRSTDPRTPQPGWPAPQS